MVRLFIENSEVVLPKDFSLTIIEENPLMTRRGEFTLDLEISLLEPKNAQIFKFLNRINVSEIFKTSEAKLIVNGKTKRGSVVYLENNSESVSVQFVAGNSEMNVFIYSKEKIWNLDWITIPEPTDAEALDSLNHFYSGHYDNEGFVSDKYWTYSIVKKVLLI